VSDPADAALLTRVLALEGRARAAHSLPELAFSIVNDSYALCPFHQAFFWRSGDAGPMTISGLATPVENSPYLVWLKSAWQWLQPQLVADAQWLTPEQTDLPDAVSAGWREWWPGGIYVLSLRRRDGTLLGWGCFVLGAPPPKSVAAALAAVAQTWGYCWEMLAGARRRSLLDRWRSQHTLARYVLLLLPLLLTLVPVRQSVLAPAEIVSLDSMVIAATLDGVIRTVNVRPNQMVRAGDVLFTLDDTVLRNQLAVATKSVEVADLELMSARARAFDEQDRQDNVSLLAGRSKEKRAELVAIEEQLQRVSVTAPQDGLVVFGDPDDWLGRPVSTGERIMVLADPAQPGVLMHLPVADAIALVPDAPVTLFLTVDPLAPLQGHVIEAGYQALPSPQGVASYRLRAALDAQTESARIGLQGTAKLYGEQVSLGYYLLRRPLAALREWTGW
jgi:multidrug efflux pump subunit AcrA (membrane-fusion protein)